MTLKFRGLKFLLFLQFLVVFMTPNLTGAQNFAFWQRPTCPAGYVQVPKNTDYVSNDFCVMQYEAKAKLNAGGGFDSDGLSVSLATHKPASHADGMPWRSINRNDARTECQSLGAGYDLISNAQWQTIARNLELQVSNWTSGTVGSGCIFQGNNGEANCGYDGANPENSSSNARGIFTLSTGQVLYDFSGNVYEWVLDDNSTSYDANAFFRNITGATHTTMGTLADGVPRSAKAQFGPSGSSYTGTNNNSGLGFGFINPSAGAVNRGGNWSLGGNAGIFYTSLFRLATYSEVNLGFRCVYSK